MMINAKKTTTILTTAMLILVVASIIASWLSLKSVPYFWIEKIRHSYVRLFDVNREANIPTWFSSTILLLSALLCARVYCQKRAVKDRYTFYWATLAVIFTGFSLDETAILHEMLILPLRAIFNFKGLFYYGWITIGIIFVVIAAIFYYRFLLSLPRNTRNFFLLAATSFISGAIIVESFTGFYAYNYGVETFFYLLIGTLEEFLEMLGVIVFIHSLLSYLAIQSKETEDNLPNRKQ